MQFMMLMIPDVYRGNRKLDPGFVPDPKKVEEMTRLDGGGQLKRRAREMGAAGPADEGDVIEIRQIFDEADFAIKK